MNIEIRDYLTGVAIVVSSLSLVLTLRNARFSRRAKELELRSQVLLALISAKNEAYTLREYFSTVSRDAQSNDLELLKMIDFHERLNTIGEGIEAVYENIHGMAPKQGMRVYETQFHRAHDMREQVADLLKAAQREVAAYHEKKNLRKQIVRA